jgi:hypothetical protein
LYRCIICRAVRGPRLPMLRHVIYRRNKQIAAELAVCGSCAAALADGVPLGRLLAKRRDTGK